MKLATYHKMQGDDVTFYKGNASDVAINESVKDILNYFTDSNVIISKAKLLIKDYIITGKNSILEILLNYVSDDEEKTFKLMKKLNMYRSAKTSGRMHELFFWDRICKSNFLLLVQNNILFCVIHESVIYYIFLYNVDHLF